MEEVSVRQGIHLDKKDIAIKKPSHQIFLLRLGPTLVGNESHQFQEYVERLLQCDRNRFIVDFGEVGYIDSRGLATLIACSRKARRQGGDLRLVRLSQRIRAILRAGGLISLFEILDTLEQAQVSFGRGQMSFGRPEGQAERRREIVAEPWNFPQLQSIRFEP